MAYVKHGATGEQHETVDIGSNLDADNFAEMLKLTATRKVKADGESAVIYVDHSDGKKFICVLAVIYNQSNSGKMSNAPRYEIEVSYD